MFPYYSYWGQIGTIKHLSLTPPPPTPKYTRIISPQSNTNPVWAISLTINKQKSQFWEQHFYLKSNDLHLIQGWDFTFKSRWISGLRENTSQFHQPRQAVFSVWRNSPLISNTDRGANSFLSRLGLHEKDISCFRIHKHVVRVQYFVSAKNDLIGKCKNIFVIIENITF